MNNQPHYLGHRKRLKKRLAQDAKQLEEYEILELLLGYALPRRDTKPLAKELISRFGSLKSILNAREQELRSVPGFGEGLEAFWILLREFWARFNDGPVRARETFQSPDQVARMARSRIGASEAEQFWLILTDNKNRLLSFERMCNGTVDQAPVYPREIFHLALQHKASGIILVHNHPGGDPSPSPQDSALTRSIQKTAMELGLRVLDHIIVSEAEYFSFQANGMMT